MAGIEIVLHYACNCRCRVCGARDSRRDEGFREPGPLVALLRQYRGRGFDRLYLGGGEPTVHPQLAGVCRAAKAVGFREIVLHSNGIVLAEPGKAAALATAGVTRVCLSLKGATADQHDAMARVQGAFHAVMRAAELLSKAGIEVEIDPLVTADSMGGLSRLVAEVAALGARRVNFWLLYLESARMRQKWGFLLPSFEVLGPHVVDACGVCGSVGLAARSYHIPACYLGPCHRASYPERSLGITVVEPSGSAFVLGRTGFSQGAYAEPCRLCVMKGHCPGVRDDYVAIHGLPPLPAVETAPRTVES